jgi:hypothetical protein
MCDPCCPSSALDDHGTAERLRGAYAAQHVARKIPEFAGKLPRLLLLPV